MIPVTQYNGHAVAVLGLGRSGLTAARALKAGGATPICWDDNEDSLSDAEAEGFLIANLHAEHVWEEHSFAALILSPGIPHLYPEPHPIVKQAWEYGVLVDNDVSLFFEAYVDFDEDGFEEEEFVNTVCVTGSNGKSTTTALIHHILQRAGRNSQMGGNIGRGVLDLDPFEKSAIYVLELSSYQTELAQWLEPDIAVFLNFSPDHYDRHGGKGGYFAAKARLIAGAKSQTLEVVIGIDEIEGQYLANQADGIVTSITSKPSLNMGGASTALHVEEGALVVQEFNEITQRFDFPDNSALMGVHNHQNACAAYGVCKALGLSGDDIIQGMKSFPGLLHRMEQVGTLGKVSFVNDSKATNVDAVAKSLDSFKNIYWIVGGQAKEGSFDALKDFIPNIKKAYLIGEAAGLFADMLGNDVPHEISDTLEKALEQATSEACASGEQAVVLLAPACASFDQFKSFEHRGDAFRQQALALIDKGQA